MSTKIRSARPGSKAERQAAGPEPAIGRRERRRVETRELIFRTALRLFADRGFPATTIEDITESADVGKGTFFNYFPSKAHVLSAFGEMQMAKAQAEMSAALAGREPMREAIKRMVRKLAEEPGRSERLARSLFSAFLTSDEVRKLMQERFAFALSLLTQALGVGQERGEIRRDRDAADMARHVLESFFGTVLLWAVRGHGPLASLLERSFDLVWASLAPSSEASGNERAGGGQEARGNGFRNAIRSRS